MGGEDLLDECLPHALRVQLVGHDAYTVAYMKWKGKSNGQLLALAASRGFDALLTTDQNIEFQHNLATLPLAIVVLQAASNDLSDLLALIPQLLGALATLAPRAVTHVP